MDQSVHGLVSVVWRVLGAAVRGGQHLPGGCLSHQEGKQNYLMWCEITYEISVVFCVHWHEEQMCLQSGFLH